MKEGGGSYVAGRKRGRFLNETRGYLLQEEGSRWKGGSLLAISLERTERMFSAGSGGVSPTTGKGGELLTITSRGEGKRTCSKNSFLLRRGKSNSTH